MSRGAYNRAGTVNQVTINAVILEALRDNNQNIIGHLRQATSSGATREDRATNFQNELDRIRDHLAENIGRMPEKTRPRTSPNGVDDSIDLQRQRELFRRVRDAMAKETPGMQHPAAFYQDLATENVRRNEIPSDTEMPRLTNPYTIPEGIIPTSRATPISFNPTAGLSRECLSEIDKITAEFAIRNTNSGAQQTFANQLRQSLRDPNTKFEDAVLTAFNEANGGSRYARNSSAGNSTTDVNFSEANELLNKFRARHPDQNCR